MGAILSLLKTVAQDRPTCPLLNTSLSKIRDYHAAFTALCDNFSINIAEFDQIFSSLHINSFSIWDTDDNGYIDALELFSGLVVFADSKFKDKIRFIFDLFDFNEIGEILTVDLQFLVICCLNSTFKIYGANPKIDHEEVISFINSYFAEDTLISLERIIKWCHNSEEISTFFGTIKKDPPGIKLTNAPIQFDAFKKFGEKKKRKVPALSRKAGDVKPVSEIFNSQKYKTKLDYLTSITSKNPPSNVEMNGETDSFEFLFKSKILVKIQDSIAKMKWVYGFRCNDIKHPLKYIGTGANNKVKSERLVYISGCVVIVYFTKANEQLHYVEHEKEIISLAVSPGGLVASGELGDKPAIHVWDSDSMQNVAVLKGIHSKGVSLLCFIKQNDLLASCGVRIDSPLLVYNVGDGTLVLSTRLKGYALDLQIAKPYLWDPEEKDFTPEEDQPNLIFSCTENELYIFTYENGVFTTGEIRMSEFQITSPITCCFAFTCDYSNDDTQNIDKKIVTLTGHSNGKVLVWENMQDKRELDDYKGTVIDITCSEINVIIASNPSFLHFWDLKLRNKLKTIDIVSLRFKLFNFTIGSLLSAHDKIYLSTVEGDVAEITVKMKKDPKAIAKIQGSRLNHICRIRGAMKALTLIERSDDTLVYVGGRSEALCAFSSESHQLVHLAGVRQTITAIDAMNLEDGKKKVCIGTESGELQIRIESQGALIGYKPSESKESYYCNGSILDAKFSPDGKFLFAVADEDFMYLFTLKDELYFDPEDEFTRKFVPLEGEVPISINFSDNSKTVLIGTNQRTHYTLDLSGPTDKLKHLHHFADRSDFSILNLRYSSLTGNYLSNLQPTSFWNTIKAVVAADESGLIFHWKDRNEIVNNSGACLKGHSSQIARFAMTKNNNIFFSLGATDRTLIEWQIENITEEKKPNEDLSGMKLIKIKSEIPQNVLKKEISYSMFSDLVSNKLRDSFIFFDGTTDQRIDTIFYQNLLKPTSIQDNTRIPTISLKLHHVYGFLSSEKRNTLFYIHSHQASHRRLVNPKSKRVKKLGSGNIEDFSDYLDKEPGLMHLPPHLQKQMLFSHEGIVPYDCKHEYCERYFLYFVSRVAIIYDPLTNTQRFYEGHRYRITTLSVHPSKMIVATGESAPAPQIHIWKVSNLEPLKIIQASHKNGIQMLRFSNDGSLLISVSVDTSFSLQIINWQTEETLAFQNTGISKIFDVLFNPYNKHEFTVVGQRSIAVWELQGRSLSRKTSIDLLFSENNNPNVEPIVTCVAYLNYHLGKDVDSDIVLANDQGEIGVVTFGKYLTLQKNAHRGVINCLRVTDMISKKLLIITTGEDEYLRIWDIAFNLIYEINIRQIDLFNMQEDKNFSIQSIDVYCCKSPSQNNYYRQKDKKEEKLNKPRILLGTRNGDIIEAIVTQNFSGIRSISDSSQMLPSSRIGVTLASLQDIEGDSGNVDSTNASINDWDLNSRSDLEGSLSLSFISYLKNHSGIAVHEKSSEYQQRVLFAVHPNSSVMYTVGENQDLYLWHVEHLKLLTVKNLGKVATVIRLSPNGDIVAIGFIDGSVVLLDGKLQEKAGAAGLIAPSLDMLQPLIIESLDPSPVLNIEFSRQEGLMAISYDNIQSKKLAKAGKFSKEGAHIAIYAPGLEELNIKNKIVMRLQYIKQIDIKPLTCLETDEGDSYLAGLAVYFMTFSADEQFLLLYFQEIDQSLSRVNESSNGFYVIRDLYTNTSVEDYETIQGIYWEKNNFPNHVSAQYSFYTEEGKREFMNFARRPTMSVMTDYQSIASPENISVVGSTNGDLYFFKSSALCPKKLSTPTQQFDFQAEEDQMYISKSFAAHISFVNQIEIKDEFLFSAGAHDGCIMQWKLINEESQWDADYANFNSEAERETVMESTHYETFRSLSTEIFPLRGRISDVSKSVQNVDEPEIELELETVIGRKAFDRKNNLYYDFDERIIYSMGNLIIVQDPVTSEGTFNEEAGSLESFEEDNKKSKKKTVAAKQEFFKIDGEASTPTAPEISALALSTDRRFICAGTQEIHASIYIWEVCSRTCIKSLKLNNCSIIQNIKFAYNSSHVCAIGISPDYTQIVYLIDSLKGQVLGYINHVNSLNEKIRDLIFFPNSIHQFITCGVQHMSVWKYSGSTLNFSSCQIEVQEISSPVKLPLQEISGNRQNILSLFKRTSASAMNESHQAPQFKLVFTSICFVQNTAITGATDGDIYIWQASGDNLKIMKKQPAHSNSAVLCLNSLNNTNVFVSGGEDGKVVIWQTFLIDKNFIVEKVYEYSITTDNIATRAALNPRNHVQSVFIGSKNILIGTKTGDIYELMKPKDIDLRWKKPSQTNLVVNKLKCNDHETPKSVGFSHGMDKIYAITHNGRFCVWDMKSVDLIYSYEFARNTISMIAFKNKPLILIVFDTKIIMLNAEKGEDYQPISGYEKEYKTQIVDVKISFNERYVAVALSSDDDRSARINLYDLDNRDGELVTFLKREVKSVKFIDFSTDNSYLLYKAADGSDKSTIINIISKAEVDLNLVEFNVEWVSDGIQLSKFTKGVQSYYSLKYNGVSNSIIKMARIGEKTLAVTDEMGTIRLFRYPCEENSGIGYYKCYNEHMNQINNFVLSVDRNYLLTSSKIDKSIFIWRIKSHSNFPLHKIEPLE